MTVFLILKVIHILGAITALGANITYAYWMRRAGDDPARVLDTIDGIRKLDNRIATPAYGVVFVAGILLVLTGNYTFGTFWIAAAIVIFIGVTLLGIFVYAPALRRQEAEARTDIASPAYAAAARRQSLLGALMTLLAAFIVVLMVTKPTL